ncbi:uncharacterized protein V6R79_006115 [Siganus canaliculatus]
MRPWLLLLLLSLFASDPSPLGDRDWVMENCSWTLYRKQMTPRGLRMLQILAEHPCVCPRTNCCSDRQRAGPVQRTNTAQNEPGCSPPRIILQNHILPLVILCCHEKGETIKPATGKSTLHTLIKADEESGHFDTDTAQEPPASGSAWLLHHPTAAPGQHLYAVSLGTSKIWTPATIARQAKRLTKRCCAALPVIYSCCVQKGEIRSALKIKQISKQQMAQLLIRRTGSLQRGTGIKVLMGYNGPWLSQASVSQHHAFQAAAPLQPGSSSVESNQAPQPKLQTNGVRVIRKNWHLNLDHESSSKTTAQRLRSAKAGLHVELRASREETESENRPETEKDFSRNTSRKQAKVRPGPGQSAREDVGSLNHTKQVPVRKAVGGDVDAGEVRKGLIVLLPADRKRETPAERKRPLSTDTVRETGNIPWKELVESSPLTGRMKEIIPVKAKKKKSGSSAEIKAQPVESIVHVEEQAKETTVKKASERSDTNLSLNETKQEEELLSTPPLQTMETMETLGTETTAASPESPADTQFTTQTPTSTGTGSEPGPRSESRDQDAQTGQSLSGLRMREDTLADGTEKKTEARDATDGPEGGRGRGLQDPQLNTLTSSKGPQTVQEEAAEKPGNAAEAAVEKQAAAPLQPGSSSVESNQAPQPTLQTNGVRVIRKNWHLNLDHESSSKTTAQRLRSAKASREETVANTVRETGNIPWKELVESSPLTGRMKEIIPVKAKKKKSGSSPEIKAQPVESVAHVEEQAEETTVKKASERSDTNLSLNETKQEEELSSTPPLQTMETMETLGTETTAASPESPADTQFTTQTPTSTGTSSEPGPRSESRDQDAQTGQSLSGLRMREDTLADGTEKKTEARDATDGPEGGRGRGLQDPQLNTLTSSKGPQTVQEEAAEKPGNAAEAAVEKQTPEDEELLCRGLIHRTAAGWKHCRDRLTAMGSRMSPSGEDAFKETAEWEHASLPERRGDPPDHDEYDHFYYFDGVLRRVQQNFYPYDKRQRRRKRSDER